MQLVCPSVPTNEIQSKHHEGRIQHCPQPTANMFCLAVPAEVKDWSFTIHIYVPARTDNS